MRTLSVLFFCVLAVQPLRAFGKESEPRLEARAPEVGKAFDDREVEMYFGAASRKLFEEGKVVPLEFDRRECSATLLPPGEDKLEPPEIASRAEAATVVLGDFAREGKKRQLDFAVAAGGFVIDPSGICVTSLHVAKSKGSRGLCAMTRDGRVFAVKEVLAADPVNDLAVLRLDLPEGVTLPALPLAAEPPPTGGRIFVMSHPDDRFYSFTAGLVSRQTVWRDKDGDEEFLSITADFAKGSSGCPVLDEYGSVVGVVNNTESIYYDDDGSKRQTDLQMVVKNATPVGRLKAMLRPPGE